MQPLLSFSWFVPFLSISTFPRPAIHLSQNMQKWARKVYSGVFHITFFFRISHLFFRFSRQGRHSREMCIASGSYFVVCFAKTLAKCEKCITSPTSDPRKQIKGTSIDPRSHFIQLFPQLPLPSFSFLLSSTRSSTRTFLGFSTGLFQQQSLVPVFLG